MKPNHSGGRRTRQAKARDGLLLILGFVAAVTGIIALVVYAYTT
jgi:hypothetical protein